MPLSRARAIAFEILCRVESEDAYATDLLHAQLSPLSGSSRDPRIKPEDAALATELTLGVLRWRRVLDFLMQHHLKKPVDTLDLPVAVALRMGLYQLWFLGRVPARAAVNESVELVKRARKSSAAGLVNAVLRRAAESQPREPRRLASRAAVNSGESAASGWRPQPADHRPTSHAGLGAGGAALAIRAADELLPAGLRTAERLGTLYSHPTWLVERWLGRFGEARTIQLLTANNRAPHLTCTVHDPARIHGVESGLRNSGLRVEPGAFLKSALAVSGGSVTQTEEFRRGELSIQDEASQMIPVLLGVRAGDRVLDLCAAPGGKTPALIRAADRTGFVVAADRHMHRLRALRAQFDRLNIQSRGRNKGPSARLFCVNIVDVDAARTLPFGARFDRILVDAPCSGTGTFARHPEIRWRLQAQQLAELHCLQAEILASAFDVLAPGGRLVYSTCSLEPEENEDVIAEVLRPVPNLQVVSSAELKATLAPHLVEGVDAASFFDQRGYFRTFPGTHPTDGFFAAALEKSR